MSPTSKQPFVDAEDVASKHPSVVFGEQHSSHPVLCIMCMLLLIESRLSTRNSATWTMLCIRLYCPGWSRVRK